MTLTRLFANPIERAGWVLDTVRDHRWAQRMMGIGPKDLVLDVGSGASPSLRSNVLCDKFVADATERHGQTIRTDRPFVVADAARLPFIDRSFDFVICEHLLEHVPDPGAVIRELQRVAPRGYIETPSAEWEKVVGFPFHRWMVSLRQGVLIFEKKQAPFHDVDLHDWFARVQQLDHFGERLWKMRRRAGVYTSLLWDKTIPHEIHGSDRTAEFVHANVCESEFEAEAAPPGIAARMLDAWGRRMRRESDVGWAEIEKRLACPECQSGIARDGNGYRCTGCGACYPVDSAGRLHLLSESESRSLADTRQAILHHGVR